MPKKIEKKTKIIEKDVDYMIDPSVSFVSLVKHGANGESFFIVKSADKKKKILQRVIVPKSLDEKKADELLKGFSTDDEKDYPTHLAYNQISADRCDKQSFEVIKMDDDMLGVVGVLKNKDDMQSIADEKDEIVKELPMETRWDIGDELWNLENIIMSVGSQSGADEKWQKNTIMTAMTNFQGFLTAALDAVSAEKMITRKTKEDIVAEVLSELKQEEQMGDSNFMFKDKEEVIALIRKCIKDFVAEKAEDEKVKKAREEEAEAKKEFEDGYAELTKKVEKLAKSVEVLENKAPERGTDEDDPEPKNKENKPDPSVFSGLFFKSA